MKKGAILRRRMYEFNLDFAWYGDCQVVVESNGRAVYELPLKSAGVRTACEMINKESAKMHELCQAFS